MAVRYSNCVGNFDGDAFGLRITVGFGFEALFHNSVAFRFAVGNVDSFGGWNLDINALFD